MEDSMAEFAQLTNTKRLLRTILRNSSMRADTPHPATTGTSRTADVLHGRSGVWLRQIIDNTPAVIFVKDLEGRYMLINKEFEALFNVQQETFSGKTDYDLFPPELAEQ